MVAVKVIKNKPAYTNQAWVEVRIASLLNRKHDPQVSRRCWGMQPNPSHLQSILACFSLLNRPRNAHRPRYFDTTCLSEPRAPGSLARLF